MCLEVMFLARIHRKLSSVSQSYWTFCNPMICSLPGSSVHGIFQAGNLKWVAIFYSRGSSYRRIETASLVSSALAGRFFITAPPRKPCIHIYSHVRLFVSPWTVVHQAPPSMGFSRQEYWSGLPSFSSTHMHICKIKKLLLKK